MKLRHQNKEMKEKQGYINALRSNLERKDVTLCLFYSKRELKPFLRFF